MNKNIQNETFDKQLNHLEELISSPKFLQKQGIGSEIPFFICPFNPRHYVDIVNLKTNLINRLKQKNIKILEINLYNLSITILKERGALADLLANETSYPKDRIKELLQNLLDPETNLVPKIKEIIQADNYDVLFISGVGEVYPYLRSHNILNNLQTVASDKPTVMFFPGEYNQSRNKGSSLDLFGILHDDRYYRAFNIYNCQVS